MENVVSQGSHPSLKEQRPFQRRFVICGSMAFAPQMERIAQHFAERDILAIPPDDVDLTAEYGTQAEYNRFKRGASIAHIRKIRDPRTIGILVANFEKHGRRSYIGPNSFAEIAIAFAGRKRVFVLDGIPRDYADELNAWGVVDLKGNLDTACDLYREICLKDRKQLKLPWS
ncbi:hypothetical protein IB277_14590 [Ensifer sp. ENS07]|uniref:hypothetical protein n=1 Tax=unclassified Ensifer TaxID=2633371 RepID=UPI001780C4C4|nr:MULTISPECIES: hypothetical protein [unclassified Ensifer]MBD9507971.1 hypothetical protein [Ensifer sp. ENS10]MBD9637532.1 hypothetical protein [Ensifer sp. ENS07]